jgi:molybdopterin-dependent oxidoreductase alpha subunit
MEAKTMPTSTDISTGDYDPECCDGHYRPKKDLREQSSRVSTDDAARVAEASDDLSSQAQNPEELAGTRIDRAYQEAAGIPAMLNVARYGLGEMGAFATLRTLVEINHEKGFDCQSCAWPSPDHKRKVFEFCENGAKAVADELTQRRITREFFALHSIEELASQSDYWLNQQGRLTEPMVRRPGDTHYSPISWDDAFELIAGELNALETPNQAAFYTSGKTMNEPAFLLQLFARQFGTNNLPDCSNMCHESSGVALVDALGVGKGTVTLEDFEHCDLILIFGNNPGTNHPRMLTSLEEAKHCGAKIIAINPLPETGLMRVVNPNPQDYRNPLIFPFKLLGRGAQLADLHLPVRVNGDVAAVKGMLKYIFEEDKAGRISGIDYDFIQKYTERFDTLRSSIEVEPWENLVEQSGLSLEQIRAAGAMCALSRATICCWATGLTQQPNGVDNVLMVLNLLLIGGHIGRSGAGTCCVRGHSNVQGDRTMGVWERPPKAFLDALGEEFGFEPPREWGLDTVETLHAMYDGDLKVFFAISGNFVSNTPDTAYSAHAISRCRLTAHVSTKLNRSHLVTGACALILPCLGRSEIDMQAGGEQYVTAEDSMGIINRSKGREKPASLHLLSDVAIISRMALAVFKNRSTVDWKAMMSDYGKIREAISRVIPGFGAFNARFERAGYFYLPNPARERIFMTPSRRAQLRACPTPAHDLQPGELLLMTVRSHDQFNSTIYGLDDRYRGIYGGRRVIFLNPADMEEIGLETGCLVDIASHFEGEIRIAPRFIVVPYTISRRSAAAYYPETNVLVPIRSVAAKSNQPSYKCIRITLTHTGSASEIIKASAAGIHENLTRPDPVG